VLLLALAGLLRRPGVGPVSRLEPQVLQASRLQDRPTIRSGILVDKVYELDLHSRTFSADGQLWLEWSPDVQHLMDRHGTRPMDLVRLLNRIETWDSTFETASPEPTELAAGRRSQLYRFSSRFYDDSIDFRRDPFDRLSLPIIVEAAQPWMASKYADLALIPERPAGVLLGESAELSGYEPSGATFRPYRHHYASRFGGWFAPQLAQVRLEMQYRSNVLSALISWVLPLLIVDAIVLMAPSVEGSLGDVRLAIPSTALLTLIFLQQSYHDGLPRLPYPTFLDDLFACSYVVAMSLFALFVWGTNLYASTPPESRDAVMVRINRVDRRFQILSVLGFLGVALISWCWR